MYFGYHVWGVNVMAEVSQHAPLDYTGCLFWEKVAFFNQFFPPNSCRTITETHCYICRAYADSARRFAAASTKIEPKLLLFQRTQPALAQTCRQIRAEYFPMCLVAADRQVRWKNDSATLLPFYLVFFCHGRGNLLCEEQYKPALSG
jgi:hypothetical protein